MNNAVVGALLANVIEQAELFQENCKLKHGLPGNSGSLLAVVSQNKATSELAGAVKQLAGAMTPPSGSDASTDGSINPPNPLPIIANTVGSVLPKAAAGLSGGGLLGAGLSALIPGIGIPMALMFALNAFSSNETPKAPAVTPPAVQAPATPETGNLLQYLEKRGFNYSPTQEKPAAK